MKIFKKVADSIFFQRFIIGVIIFAALLVGLETNQNLMEKYEGAFHLLDRLIIWTFLAEALIKILSFGSKPHHYFKDPWNVFDFIIVTLCFLPINAQYIAVVRLVRILRVFRLISVMPSLRLLTGALLKSIPSMGSVGLLLFLLFYVFAVMGVFLFGENDPFHFGSLQSAFLTLFQTVTMEGWVDVFRIQFYGSNAVEYDFPIDTSPQSIAQPTVAVLYFIFFILLGTMIFLNLFIGVIVNGMDEIKAEVKQEIDTTQETIITLEKQELSEVEHLQLQIKNLEQKINDLIGYVKK
ncbi:MAG: ion transporter [Chitinophagales bacterium]